MNFARACNAKITTKKRNNKYSHEISLSFVEHLLKLLREEIYVVSIVQ